MEGTYLILGLGIFFFLGECQEQITVAGNGGTTTPRLVRDLMQEYTILNPPGVSFKYSFGSNHDARQALISNSVDFALLDSPPSPTDQTNAGGDLSWFPALATAIV